MKISLHDNKLRELGSRGASHLIVPLLAVVVMGVGGAYAVVSSHADPANATAVAAGASKLSCSGQLLVVNGHVVELTNYNKLYYEYPDPSTRLATDKVDEAKSTKNYTSGSYKDGSPVQVTVTNYGINIHRHQAALAFLKAKPGANTTKYEAALKAFEAAVGKQQAAVTQAKTSWKPGTQVCGTNKQDKAVAKLYKARNHDLNKLNKGKKLVDKSFKKTSSAYHKAVKANKSVTGTRP